MSVALSTSAMPTEGTAAPDVIKKQVDDVTEGKAQKKEQEHAAEEEQGKGCNGQKDDKQCFHRAPPVRKLGIPDYPTL